MIRLSSLTLVTVLVLAGCRDKQPAKQTPATSGSGSAQPAGDAKWLERLPTATGTNPVMLQFTAGLVRVDATGAITVASAPTAAATDPRHPVDPFVGGKPVKLEELAATLGLPPVTPRTAAAFDAGEGSAGSGSDADPNDIAFAHLGHPMAATGAPAPAHRATSAFGVAHPHEVNGGIVVFADAQATAATLVDVLAQTGGFLAVRDGDGLGALSLALDRHAPAFVQPVHPWVEARLGTPLEVESVPSKPSAVASLDKLAGAMPMNTDAVDVLVSSDTKVQDLVTAIGLLRTAKINAIGIGRAPAAGTPEAAARGDHGARVVLWDVYVSGADKTKYEETLSGTLERIRTCYTEVLMKQNELAGTAQVELAIGSNGKVSIADATGVPKPLSMCVADATRAATFPTGAAANTRVSAKLAFLRH